MTTAPSRTVSPWRRRAIFVAGPLAIAGAIALYVAGRGPELPAYAVTTSSEPAHASAPGRLRLAPSAQRGARFEVVLRPERPPVGKVVAYAFRFAPAMPEPVPLDANVSLAPDGAVRVAGPSRELDGADEVRVVLGEPKAIGKFDDAAARAAAKESSSRVRVVTVPIDRE